MPAQLTLTRDNVTDKWATHHDLILDDRLANAMALAFSCAPFALSLALDLPDLGAIDLPDARPAETDLSQLQVFAPLYLAYQMDAAGLFTTAERIAGLFASGAITQPLGNVAAQLNALWRTRQQRLNPDERQALLQQAFDEMIFPRMMQQLCSAMVALSDNNGVVDIREGISLDLAIRQMREYSFSRTGGLLTFAASDLLAHVRDILQLLRSPPLLQAFSARSLWHLLSLSGSNTETAIRGHVDRASAGVKVLHWMTKVDAGQQALLNNNADTIELFSAAQRWLMANDSVGGLGQ